MPEVFAAAHGSLNATNIYSTDGIQWNNSNSGTPSQNYRVNRTVAIAFGNNRFVGIPEPSAGAEDPFTLTSNDGNQWLIRPNAPEKFQKIFFHEGLFYVGSVYSRNCYTSPDGVTWTYFSELPQSLAFRYEFKVENNLFFIMGSNSLGQRLGHWSEDCINWNNLTTGGPSTVQVSGQTEITRSIAYGNGYWVVVSYVASNFGGFEGNAAIRCFLYYSTDMVTWTKKSTNVFISPATANNLRGPAKIIFFDGRFYVAARGDLIGPNLIIYSAEDPTGFWEDAHPLTESSVVWPSIDGTYSGQRLGEPLDLFSNGQNMFVAARYGILRSNSDILTPAGAHTWNMVHYNSQGIYTSVASDMYVPEISIPIVTGGSGGSGWSVGTTFIEHSRHGLFDTYSAT